ncbi:c-type cytochrome [Longimicrobium sp.]|jgi:mono/diheme cytochrome c family protein|uniref:c-type cytochrome n=1 Tax=Longimicrobium sp. TaxID=2029185 RepID=UPI002F93904D
MAYVFRGRPAPAALLLAAALLAGCEPGAQGGYAKISYRGDPQVPSHAYPEPPTVVPGTSVGAAAAKVVLANPPAGVTQAMVDAGQASFGTVCSACHGQNGTGSPAGPALNDRAWLNISGQYPEIVTLINSGVPKPKQYPGMMPPKGGGAFDDAQVRSIAAYVYALSQQGGA